MKYALFVYETPGSWHDLSTEQKHALHDQYRGVAASPASSLIIGFGRHR